MKITAQSSFDEPERKVDFRLLEQRSRLEFNFPKGAGEGDAYIAVFLPFYENPQISESKAANYAEYDVLGRSSTLYAYTSAKARKFKVEISYNMFHLMQMDMTQSRFKKYFTTNHDEKNKFFDIGKPTTIPETQAEKLYKEYYSAFSDINGFSHLLFHPNEFPKETIKTIDTMLFFINILRSSVYNNATNPLLGPPLVRLNHGALYQSIPCIVKSYDLNMDDQAGIHVETLMPNRVVISLELNEVRAGDFGYFEKAVGIKRDNLAGWESVLGEPHSLDPGVL